uniref:Uncharacterized protein n=1 Tax=Melopsittacus undulatus TaxID=13146 RepID=A0A8V5HFM7_MELUD
MRNSPTMCQWYVDLALQKWREKYSKPIVYHYMDDILIATPESLSEQAETDFKETLQQFGLYIAPEKIQRRNPWLYLGMMVTETRVRQGKLKLQSEINTVNDVQKLVGDIQWIRTWCGITNEDLEPLFELLKDSVDPLEPRHLTNKAHDSLKVIETKIEQQQVYRYDPEYPVMVLVYGSQQYRSAIIAQQIEKHLAILEWVFPSYQPSASVTTLQDYIGSLLLKAKERVRLVFGVDPSVFVLPWKTTDLIQEWSLCSMTFALAVNGVQLSTHYPSHPLFQTTSIIMRGPIVKQKPISNALTVFTDASGRTGKYGFAWQDNQNWKLKIWTDTGKSVQILELQAIVETLNWFSSQALNIVSDSAYAVSVVNRIDCAKIGKIGTLEIEELVIRLKGIIQERKEPIWCCHMRSHTNLPGIFSQGNAVIDRAVAGPVVLRNFEAARQSHEFFHQSSRGLQQEFGLSRSQARNIVAACPDCARIAPLQQHGVNPRGLGPRKVWQTDVTEYPPFGRLKYLHVSVDTHSHAVWASALTTTAFKAVKQHWLQAFAVLGVPEMIKTDNAPSYVGHWSEQFLKQWGVKHVTGIPYNTTGQGIVERRHQDIKRLLGALKKEGEITLSPHDMLAKACYVLNWKNPVSTNDKQTVIPIHLHYTSQNSVLKMPVRTWDPKKGAWGTEKETLFTWGRGYACVSTGDDPPRWVPAKWVKPWLEKKGDSEETRGQQTVS